MRIALLSHYPDDETAPAGGVWAVGRNLAAGLVAAGAEVHVVRYVAAPAGSQPRTVVGGRPPLVVHTVLLPRRRSQPLRRVAAAPALIQAVQAIRPDAISAHESEYGLAAVRSGFPAAVTIHGIPRQEFCAFRGWRSWPSTTMPCASIKAVPAPSSTASTCPSARCSFRWPGAHPIPTRC